MTPPRSAFGAPPRGGTASEPAKPDPRRSRGRGGWLGLTLMLVSALAVLGALLVGMATTDRGSAWLLARVSGLVVAQPQGRLFGGPFAAERIELQAGSRRIVVEGLAWRDARWAWRPHDGAWVGLVIDGAQARRVDVGAAATASETPAAPPDTLRLPFALALDRLQVAQFALEGRELASDIGARIELAHERGSQHRVSQLAARTARGRIEGRLAIAADAPFAVDAALRAESLGGVAPRWWAEAEARGPLAALALQARLGSPDAAGAEFDAQATLSPFAAWPLSALQARARELDLAALIDGAPRTRLAGDAQIDTRGLDQPMAARIRLANATPGRWDAGRLPLAALELDLAGRPDQRDRLAIQRFELRLPADGGRATGQGEWQAGAARLDVTLHALRPDALDARAPAMTLGGTLAAQLDGLPAPDGSRAAAPVQSLRTRLALDGRFDARRGEAARVRGELAAQRSAGAWQLQLTGLEARAGAAELRGQLQAERRAGATPSAAATVHLGSDGEARGFDPSRWWAGAPRAQLHARWQTALQAPAAALDALPRQVASWLAVRGQARLDLQPSQLAGVPLRGQVRLDGQQPGWSVDADLQAGGNRARVQGRLAPRADDDRWQAELDAPALAALRPLLAATGLATRAAGLDGKLVAQAQTQGRWPVLRSQGSARADGLRAGAWSAQRLAAQWQAGPDRDAALAVSIDGERLSQGTLTLDSLRAGAEGSLARHRLTLDATSGLRPPAWTDALQAGATTPRGSRVQLNAEGRWQAAAGASSPWAGEWQARVAEVDARGRDTAQPWLAARDLQLQLALDGGARLVRAQAAPGRANVLGAPLTWREASYRVASASQPAQWLLDAELEPLAVAPWLARAWPAAGLGGDLALKGRIVVRRSERFAADLVLERAGGDLSLTTEGVSQTVGLTDLRLAMVANDGTWHFTQALAGANMGVLAGAQTLRVAPSATWPAPDTPMQGVLEWRVADLGVWAPFTPPGWRVGGRLRTSAALGGRFGAPEIEGRMEGSGLAVRNILQGVDLRDGELALSLRGDAARIERFVFKGGDGQLRLTGGATLGAEPAAKLELQAERFRVLGRADRRIVASGEATLALDAKSLGLDGKLAIDEGLIDVSRSDAPRLDDDVTVRGGRHAVRPAQGAASAADTAAPARPAAAPRQMRVAVQLDLGRQLRLRGRGLDTRLAGTLAVSAPGGRLALNGQVSALDGTYAAYGQKLEIERGVVAFTGAAENPRLDILAVRPNLDVTVGVLIGGTAQSPRVRLYSEPEMSEYDKLSWLVLGRAGDGLARADTALLQRAALALLAGENGSPDAALLSQLGLDELSVRQQDSGQVQETVVSVGKQLSRRWYVGYERSVNSTAGTWQLIYRAAQRFTLRAQSGADNSLDAIWTWRWN
jgi:translocation and assembly module TamB